MYSKIQSRRFLRLPEVKYLSGYCRTSIYEKIKAGKFPKPYPLGARAVGWLSEDIEDWVESRIKARQLLEMESEEGSE